MLQRAQEPVRPILGARRLVSLGGQALEAVGRARMRFRARPTVADRHERARWLHAACARLCQRHGFCVEISGILPRGPALLVANHVSYIDPVVIGSLVPCVPLAKAEIAGWPIVGAAAQALGVLFVQRGDVWSGARALRTSLRHLASGVSILGFPEGTTGRDELLPFHRGLFGIARRAQVPIVPIALSYDDRSAAWVGDEWFLPHLVRTAMRPRTRAWIRIGSPIAPDAPARELAAAARAQITTLLARCA
jgi:1-acyl-sn-glycerol-3-phosphate acyltransferase